MISFRNKLALAASLIALGAQAGDAPLTLNQCRDRALAASPALAANRHDIAAAEAAVRRERAALLPFFSGSFTAQTLHGDSLSAFALASVVNPDDGSTQPFVSSITDKTSDSSRTTTTTHTDQTPKGTHKTRNVKTTDTTQTTTTVRTTIPKQKTPQTRSLDFPTYGLAGVAVDYPLIGRGNILGLNSAPSIAYARSVLDQQRSTGRLTREELVYTVSSTFLTAVWARQQAEFDREISDLLTQRLGLVKEEISLGLRVPEDGPAAERQLAAAKDHAAATRQLADEAQNRLARHIHIPPPKTLSLSAPKTVAPMPPLAELIQKTSADHPQVQVQQSLAEQARQQYRIARSAQWPTVSLQGSYATANDWDNPGRDLFVAGVRVDVPLFDFGARSAATRQARETWLAEQARTDKAGDDLFNAIADVYEVIHNLEFVLADAERDLVSAEAAVRVLENQREVELAKPIALVDARLTALAKRQLVTRTHYQHRVELATLQRTVAGVWQWAP